MSGKTQQSHGNDGLCPVGQLAICFNLDEKKEPLCSETSALTSESMVSELPSTLQQQTSALLLLALVGRKRCGKQP